MEPSPALIFSMSTLLKLVGIKKRIQKGRGEFKRAPVLTTAMRPRIEKGETKPKLLVLPKNSPHSARREEDGPAGDARESRAEGGGGRAEEEAVHLAVVGTR